jgi:hypothetical protein
MQPSNSWAQATKLCKLIEGWCLSFSLLLENNPFLFELGAFELIEDESKAGACLWISKRKGMVYWPTSAKENKYLVYSPKTKKELVKNRFPSIQPPEYFHKM